ncbi:MAG: 5'-3' exonuclease H3TH domain-containing protein, partial [Candidatus Paceibacteria bacterium]
MSDTEQQRFVILDSNALIHRSYHALPDLSTKNGTQVNAVYGYVAVLLKVLRELQPTYIGAAFDLEGPTFRDEMYEAYKAQREKSDQALYDQIPLTKEVLNSFGIPVLTAEGYEADDVIGTVAARMNEEYPHVEVIIVTGDMDTMQLVNEQTKVFSLRKGVKDTVIYDVQGVQEKYGLNPDQVADFKGLKGDPSDNIPGVSGIGDKTAQKILAHFQDLDSLYETLNTTEGYEELSAEDQAPISQKVYTKLRQSEEQARFSKELATINCEVPLEFTLTEYAVEDFDRNTIAHTLREYEFDSLISRLDEILGESDEEHTSHESAETSDTLPLN